MATDGYARGADIATIVAALVTAAAFVAGVWQFSRTQSVQREVKAIELFVEYNKAMQENIKLEPNQHAEAPFWKGNLTVAIAESIWVLTHGEPGWWEATVAWMLAREKEFITKHKLNCKTFDGDFIKFAEGVLKMQVCGT